jgi:hypothetical protein
VPENKLFDPIGVLNKFEELLPTLLLPSLLRKGLLKRVV